MGISGTADGLSEESKKNLQSETWQKAGDAIRKKKEIRHFTMEAAEDNTYGHPWDAAVHGYLMTGYMEEQNQHEVVADGRVYKILKRREVTVFYDADGNTLFDVENGRLAKEFDALATGKKEMPEDDATDQCMGNAREQAKEKLEKELRVAADRGFAKPVIGYLLERCKEDRGLAQDVIQEHKTWKKCVEYIYSQARKQTKGNYTYVCDDVVYEWAEDYYHRDDKAEEEKKAREEAEKKRKKAERAAGRKAKEKPVKTAAVQEKKEASPKNGSEPQKNNRNMEGQLDMFSMMEM